METVIFEPDADPPRFVYTEVKYQREYEQVYECEWVQAKPDGEETFHDVLVPREESSVPPKKVLEYVETHDISLHPESRITRASEVSS